MPLYIDDTPGLTIAGSQAGDAPLLEPMLDATLARVPDARVKSLVRAGRMSSLKPIYVKDAKVLGVVVGVVRVRSQRAS